MQTPIDASTSESVSAVYYSPGMQQPAASIATSIGVKPTQVLAVSSRDPGHRRHGCRRRRGDRRRPGVDVHVHDGQLLTLSGADAGPDDAAARQLPAQFRPFAADPAHSALFLDFDGTLSGIVKDPRAARPLPGVRELLADLAGRVRVGRGRSRVARPRSWPTVLGEPPGVTLAGLYGLERALRGPDHDAWAAVIDAVVAEASAQAPPGVYVEPKGLTVTLHWRQAHEHEGWVVDFAERQRAARGLRVVSGRHERELRPPLPRRQGHRGARARPRARRRRAHSGRPGLLRHLAAFGDDVGDLPAFAALGDLAAARRRSARRRARRRGRPREPGRGGGAAPISWSEGPSARSNSCEPWPTPRPRRRMRHGDAGGDAGAEAGADMAGASALGRPQLVRPPVRRGARLHGRPQGAGSVAPFRRIHG